MAQETIVQAVSQAVEQSTVNTTDYVLAHRGDMYLGAALGLAVLGNSDALPWVYNPTTKKITALANGSLNISNIATLSGVASYTVGSVVVLVFTNPVYGLTHPWAGQSGPYVVTTVGDGSHPTELTRTTTFNATSDLILGQYVVVTGGIYQGVQATLTTWDGGALDTSALGFALIGQSSPGSLPTATAIGDTPRAAGPGTTYTASPLVLRGALSSLPTATIAFTGVHYVATDQSPPKTFVCVETGAGTYAWYLLAAGVDATSIRTILGAGTSSLALSVTTPAPLGSATVGVGTTAARSDHVHQMPSAASVGAIATSSLANTDPQALGSTNAGVATTVSRSDHVHPLPTAGAIGALSTSDLSNATPAAPGAASAGVATTISRADHVHTPPTPAQVGLGVVTATGATAAIARAAVSAAATSTLVGAGFGMIGGGDLSANRSLAVDTTVIATRDYVASAVGGLLYKAACKVAAAGNISPLSGDVTIDSVPLTTGDRVLLTAQSTATENGPWVVGTPWSRPSPDELQASAAFPVSEGSIYHDSLWYITTDDPITPGVTDLTLASAQLSITADSISDATTPGKDLLTAVSNTAQRTFLGLGGSATLNVGATTGTVAAGDDSRFTNARAPTAHKATHAIGGTDVLSPSDIGAIGATTLVGDGDLLVKLSGAPSNLAVGADGQFLGVVGGLPAWSSLGGAALLNVGTIAGTVAAGNDSRIVGAVPSTRLLAGLDLSVDRTASALKTALAIASGDVSGLGGAATLNVGITGGTVAAGDDSRLTNTRTPSPSSVTWSTLAATIRAVLTTPRYVMTTANASVNATQGTVSVGGTFIAIDPSVYDYTAFGLTQVWTFVLSGAAVSGQSGTVVLYDVTNSATAATITINNTNQTPFTAPVTVPLGATLYRVDFSASGTTTQHYATVKASAVRISWV